MAIRDDSKYVEDNMDYKSKKDEMQKNNNMKMAGGVFNISDYNKYKKAVEDDNVREVFPDTSIFELEKMRELYEKEKARKLQG